jgi:release factor glutamine methyltransferase
VLSPQPVGAWLDGAATRLAGHPHPRREARALWAAVARVAPGDAWLARDTVPTAALVERFEEALDRRCRGEPFAYAVGRTAFRRLELLVDRRALIPRPETEGLVELTLAALQRGAPAGRVADIGTGCGCVALSFAVEDACTGVVAVDRDARAAALARENVGHVRPPVPVEVREGDLLGPLGAERFRAIVANLPYLTEAELEALDPGVRDFEPRAALDGGADGLAPTRRLLAQARAALLPGGVLALEIDERRAAAVATIARGFGWADVSIHEDLFGRPRYALAYEEAR